MSSDFIDSYRKKNPNIKFECPENHGFSTDRACEDCGYGIWTDDIICCHCGAENTCVQCFPEEFEEVMYF